MVKSETALGKAWSFEMKCAGKLKRGSNEALDRNSSH